MKKLSLGLVLGLVSLLPFSGASAVTYDVAADFSTVSNPNGAWSYGSSTTLGGAFANFANAGVGVFGDPNSNIGAWSMVTGGAPVAFKNTSGATQVVSGSISLAAGQFALHPGSLGEFAIARWTASTAGGVLLSALFSGQDTVGTTTDVHVLLNGVSVFNGLINGFGSLSSFASTLSVSSGSTIDFAVGYGSNATYWNDSTGLSASLSTTPIPEPSTLLLFGIALVGFAGTQRRKMLLK